MKRWLAALSVGTMLIGTAGCSSSTTTTSPHPTATTTAPAARTPVQTAHDFGLTMLDRVALPADAAPYDGALPAILANAGSTPAVSNLVEQHRVWTARESAATLRQFRFTPLSRGFDSENGAGSIETPEGKAWTFLSNFAVLPLNIALAQLNVAVTDRVGGGSVIRVDSLVSWTPVKPATEYVPARDRVVTVTATHWPTSPHRFASVVITDPARVREFIETFDHMRLAVLAERRECGPSTVFVPAVGAYAPNGTTYELAFSIAPGGRPDLVAVLWTCAGVGVSAGGHIQPTLSLDENLHRQVGRALAVVQRAP